MPGVLVGQVPEDPGKQACRCRGCLAGGDVRVPKFCDTRRMPDSELSIPVMDNDNLEPLFQMYWDVVEDGGAMPVGGHPTIEVFEEGWIRNRFVFVAWRDGRAVGTYFLRSNFPAFAAHIAQAGYIVAREARRSGIGTAMLRHSLDQARNLGFTAMMFNLVLESNPSRRLYEAAGFAVVGRVCRRQGPTSRASSTGGDCDHPTRVPLRRLRAKRTESRVARRSYRPPLPTNHVGVLRARMTPAPVDAAEIEAIWPLTGVSIGPVLPSYPTRRVFRFDSDQGAFVAKVDSGPRSSAVDPLYVLDYLVHMDFPHAPPILNTRTGERVAHTPAGRCAVLEWIPRAVDVGMATAGIWRELGEAAGRLNAHRDFPAPFAIPIGLAEPRHRTLKALGRARREVSGISEPGLLAARLKD